MRKGQKLKPKVYPSGYDYEVQIKYTENGEIDWRTWERCTAENVREVFNACKRRFKNLRIRLLQDGKQIAT